LLDRFGQDFLRRNAERAAVADDPIHVLNPVEREGIRRVARGALLRAVAAGVVNAILTGLGDLLAQHLFGPLSAQPTFAERARYWSVFGTSAVLFAILEVAYLGWDGLRSVTRLSAVAGLELSGPENREVALALARAALGALPNGAEHDVPLLLVLSLSAFDYVGHVHGPDSWESWEVLRELDDALGVWFTELEQRFGDRLTILLSADHGTTPLPETHGVAAARPWCDGGPDPYERPCSAGQRLYRDDLERRLTEAARAALGPGEWIRAVVEPFAYFTAAAQALPAARRAALEKAASAALAKHPGVARVFVSRAFSAPCPPSADESLDALVCRSLPKNAGDLYIVVKPGSFFDPHLVKGHGINHGSPYLYDRSVPLLLRAPRGAHAGARVTDWLRPADFTATAAAALQIRPPIGAADGRNLLAVP